MMSKAPAILAEGLVKTYGKTTALAGLDLTVPAGTVYGLLGPNGAGKTTAVRVFSTLLRPNRGRAQVLFLDEPTTGLDPNARAMTWEIVRGLADSGTTLLLTTQYLDEADQLAGRIAVIDGGTVIAEGTPDQLKSALGGEHLEVALAAGADVEAAIVAVKPYAAGSVQPDEDGRRLSVPVTAAEGLTTRVVRALDQAGVQVNDVTMQRASLDDVFLALTGHATAPAEDTSDDEEGSEAA